MTDQVPNFTLPSQEAAVKGSDGGNPLLAKTLSVAKKVVPPVVAIALGVFAISRLLKKAQERQLRDFQTQLKSFSSMLDLDAPADASPADAKSVMGNANMAKQILESSTKKYKFRGDGQSEEEDVNISSKVRLDLFRAGGSGGTSPKDEIASTINVEIPDVAPESDYEKAIAQCVSKVENGDDAAKIAAVSALSTALETAGLSELEAKTVFESFLSRVVSAQIDRAALHLDSDDAQSLKNLHEITLTLEAAKTLGPDSILRYEGAHTEHMEIQELLYRRYAVFCLSSEDRVKVDLHSLDDMQRLLSVSDARAETINTEIAKGMFQIAVSAAMADGGLKEEDREALDQLKESFGGLLDGGSADSITSEVAVMRAMYSLQQLLKEQGVTADDVREMRKMCKELGVDIDEMLQSADALGDALGPEAKEFVESLKSILNDNPEDMDTGMVTSVKTIDATQNSSPSTESS